MESTKTHETARRCTILNCNIKRTVEPHSYLQNRYSPFAKHITLYFTISYVATQESGIMSRSRVGGGSKEKSFLSSLITSSLLHEPSNSIENMAESSEDASLLKNMMSLLQFSDEGNGATDSASGSVYSDSSEAESAYRSTWVDLYRKYRRPMAPSSWKWDHASRPGKHCDLHLLDYLTCIDRTKDQLGTPFYRFMSIRGQLSFNQSLNPWITLSNSLLQVLATLPSSSASLLVILLPLVWYTRFANQRSFKWLSGARRTASPIMCVSGTKPLRRQLVLLSIVLGTD